MENILRKIKSVKLCTMSHPDNVQDSEFEDRITYLEEIENVLSNLKYYYRMARSKKTLKVGDKVVFNTGNYAGLSGFITEIDWNSKHKNAIYGFYHTIQLSNGHIGHIEKSEHWQFS